MGTTVIDANTQYGSGGYKPNPDWDQWNANATQLRNILSSTPPALQGQVQQRLDALLAQEPPRALRTELGVTVDNTNAMGDSAAAEVRQGADDMRTVGHEAYTDGNARADVYTGQSNAAGNRAAPVLTTPAGGRTEQQAAGAAAAGFTAPQDAAQRVIDAGNYYGQNVANVSSNRAQDIAGFRANDQGAAGIRNAGASAAQQLQTFAKGPSGPSAAEAMLRLQAARDKASALSRARSARGGPGAVNEAMKMAQAEGAVISADTRGQLATVRAQEAAQVRGERLTALTNAGQLNLGGQQAATGAELQGSGQNLQAASTAGALAVQGAQGAGELAVQGATAGGQLALGASGQQLQATQIRADIANNVRAMDIDEAKAQLSAELQTMSLNDEQTRFFAGLGEQARQDAVKARADATLNGANADAAAAQIQLQYAETAYNMLTTDQQLELQRAGIIAGVVQANNANKAQERQQILGFLGGGLMAGATLGASDRRVKRDIKRLRSMADALRKTPGSSYRYKHERNGKGQFTGPMAQDLEKTPEFRGAVVEVNGVKMVDSKRLVFSHHAALSDLQRQIDRLEKLGRKKPKRDEPEDSSGKRAEA